MTYQKCPDLLIRRDSISQGFFHTHYGRHPSPQPRIALRWRNYESAARPISVTASRGSSHSPAPRPAPHPPCSGGRFVARGGKRAFLGFLGGPRHHCNGTAEQGNSDALRICFEDSMDGQLLLCRSTIRARRSARSATCFTPRGTGFKAQTSG